jgi:hypothetical protein
MKEDLDIPNVVDSRNRTQGCRKARQVLGRRSAGHWATVKISVGLPV